jgi:hypothetical protein
LTDLDLLLHIDAYWQCLQLGGILQLDNAPYFDPDPPGSPISIGEPHLAPIPDVTTKPEAWAVTIIIASFQDALNPMRFVYQNVTLWCGPSWQVAKPYAQLAVRAAALEGPYSFKTVGVPGGAAGAGPGLPSQTQGAGSSQATAGPTAGQVDERNGARQQPGSEGPAAAGSSSQAGPSASTSTIKAGKRASEVPKAKLPPWVWALVGVAFVSGAQTEASDAMQQDVVRRHARCSHTERIEHSK